MKIMHHCKLGEIMHYGINWRMDDKTRPRSLMLALVVPVWILPAGRYYVDEYFPEYEYFPVFILIGKLFPIQ